MKAPGTSLHIVDTLNICIKKFNALNIIFDKMTACLTYNYPVGVSNKHCLLSLSHFN